MEINILLNHTFANDEMAQPVVDKVMDNITCAFPTAEVSVTYYIEKERTNKCQ